MHLQRGDVILLFLVRQKYDSLSLSPNQEIGKLTKAPICIIP
jgi:hypothetical protein